MTRLVVVASNPPTTSGTRTRARAELARALLGHDEVEIVNLFPHPSYRTGELAELGREPEPWLSARPGIEERLAGAAAAVLAYGVVAPSGPARVHFREQAAWVDGVLRAHGVPAWWVGGRPTHPSRWQRHTYRATPDLVFVEGLKVALEIRVAAG